MQSITSMPQRLRESSQRIGAFTPTGTKLLINIYAHKFAKNLPQDADDRSGDVIGIPQGVTNTV